MKTSRRQVRIILSLLLAVSLALLCGCGAGKVTTEGQEGSAIDHPQGKPRVILFTQPG